ncbi:hypothetical protein ECE50_019170 [Chitinophaga sp. Mgbs1]|uniref:DUF5977 domain-containing protein n=1 Tax=Chitinophaga solisilvae TaxID=1233460 RepID=A0A9Q5GTU9_9BACT|nr:hypothetical protein [Chitinophaga solisilvae]
MNAQQAANWGNNVPASADIVATTKTANIAVNYFSGLPSISIPIFSYSKSGINADIALNYAAGGVKVAEDATNVGLGWQLSAGGVISRSMRGIPDDCPGRGYMFTRTVNLIEPGVRPPRGAAAYAPGYTGKAYHSDSVDSQCDVFQFHVGEISGEFIIGKDKKVVLLPEGNLKISYKTGTIEGALYSSITEFTITAEDGTSYLFSEKEITKRNNVSAFEARHGYVTAWYLKQILSPFGIDTIKFNYKEVIATKTVVLPSTRMYDGFNPPVTIDDTEITQVNSKYLTEIIYPYSLRVRFNYHNVSRCDVAGQYALNTIEIRDTLLRSGVKFNYRYFTETAGKEYPMAESGCTNEISKLKLQGITPYNQFGNLPGYDFEYANLGVPKTSNNGRDHWGYFNGKNNIDLFPPIGNLPGADRNPDAQFVKAGSLTAIKYPSGRKTVFDFELNDAGVYYYSEQKAMSTGPNHGNAAEIYLCSAMGNPITLTMFGTSQRGTNCSLNYTLKNAAGVIIDQFSSSEETRQLNVPVGNYTLSWVKSAGCADDSYLNFYVSWINEIKDSSYQQTAGLRIKQITDYDSIGGQLPLVRRFSYKDSRGKSTGILISKPAYDYPYLIVGRHIGQPDIPLTCRVSEPINNLNYVNGGLVGYTSVDEIVPGGGKTTYEYSSYIDKKFFPPRFTFPFADVFLPVWLTGLPLKQSVFDESGKKIQQTENVYETSFRYLVDTLYKSVKLSPKENRTTHPYDPYYSFSEYYPVTGKALSVGKNEVRYSGTDSSVSVMTMTYDTLRNLKSTRVVLNKKLGKYQETRYYYPYNYTLGGAIKQMKDSGIHFPVSVEKWLITPAGEFLTDISLTDFQVLDNGAIGAKNVYSLQSANPVPAATVGPFNSGVLNRYPELIKLYETVDKFDSKSVSVEYTNIPKQLKEAIIWDDQLQLSLASVINAGLSEIAYTSFEYDNHGRWSVPAGSKVWNTAATGRRAFQFTGSISTTVTPGKKYYVTYWTTGAGAVVNGTTGTKIKTRQGWSLYSHMLDANTSNIALNGSSLTIDELRAYPVNARMHTQTPDPYLGIISKCDALNNIRYFAFDDQGRERLTKDEYGNITSMNCYGRAGEQVDCNAVYRNNEARIPFIQQGCANGKKDTIVYIVPAGKYTSSLNQYTVDSLAAEDVRKNGQPYANAQGTCGTVYIKLVYENFYLRGTQAVAYFYADAACTRPRVVNNLIVNFAIENTCEAPIYSSVVANGTSYLLTGIADLYYQTTICDDFGQNCRDVNCIVRCQLMNGDYIIK